MKEIIKINPEKDILKSAEAEIDNILQNINLSFPEQGKEFIWINDEMVPIDVIKSSIKLQLLNSFKNRWTQALFYDCVALNGRKTKIDGELIIDRKLFKEYKPTEKVIQGIYSDIFLVPHKLLEINASVKYDLFEKDMELKISKLRKDKFSQTKWGRAPLGKEALRIAKARIDNGKTITFNEALRQAIEGVEKFNKELYHKFNIYESPVLQKWFQKWRKPYIKIFDNSPIINLGDQYLITVPDINWYSDASIELFDFEIKKEKSISPK